MVDLDAVFADFDDADPQEGGGKNPKIKANGEFIIEVEEIKFLESKQYNAIYFIVEFRVVSSNTDKIEEGQLYSWTHDMTNKWYGAANTKQFIAAAAGLAIDSPEAKALKKSDVLEAWSDEQPLKGCQVQLKTSYKETKGKFDFWVHDWTPMTEDAA